MYRCDDNIGGCLSVAASRVGSGLRVTACRAGAQVSVAASRIGSGLRVTACRAGAQVSVAASRIGSGLRVTAGIVCTVNRDAYLRIAPDVVWLDSSTVGGEFEIYSNVVWRIE